MKNDGVNKNSCIVSSLRAGVFVLYCVFLCFMCIGCRSSRSVSQNSTIERHEVFDNTTAADSLDFTRTTAELDTAVVNINEHGTDTIKIERDSAGLPVLIVWTHNANLFGTFSSSKISDLGYTGFHMSGRNESTGTVDHIDQKKEESKTEVDPAIFIDRIIGPILLGLVIIYVICIIISNTVWPNLKKLIFTRQSNK